MIKGSSERENGESGAGPLDHSATWPLLFRLRHYANAVWAENIKEWKLELTYPLDFLRSLIDPVVYLLPYVLYGIALVGGRFSPNLQKLVGTTDIVSFITIGYIFIGFMNMALWAMGFSLRKEQMYGTLEPVFAAPVPRWVFTMGMSMHSILHQFLMIVAQLIFILAVFSLKVNPLGLLPSLAMIGLMLVALYGIGMIMASTTLLFKQGWLISEALGSLLMVVTPIAYPLAVLPVFMQKVALAVPTTYGILTARHFLLGEQMGFSVLTAFVRVAILCVIWVVFGLVVFTVIDKSTRRSGTLSHY
ncbi:ABC transporter permease [candidate division WOR-3 bacterium]|nr:ABC transporter permease [candidate division WOR-3 bacterium]